MSRLVVGVLGCVWACCAMADTPLYENEPSGNYMREWLLLGPLPLVDDHDKNVAPVKLPGMYRDYLEAYGGESHPRIAEGVQVSFEGGSATWTRHRAPNDTVDLDESVSKASTAVAYAYAEVSSATKQGCILALGSNDGIRAWVNGTLVWDHPAARRVEKDHDLIPVILEKGRNTVLLKVEQRGDQWGFACRFTPLDQSKLLERFRPFEVTNDAEGNAILRVMQSEAMLAAVAESATLEAASLSAPDKVVWRGTWKGEQELPLGVDASTFNRYMLRIAMTLQGGATHNAELPFTAGKCVEHTLFADGRTDYSIVVAQGASESEKWAANELQHWLKEVSGADFPMVESGSSSPNRAIYVGLDDRVAKRFNALGMPDLLDESFVYQTAGPSIAIYGGKVRGTMYGVMSFLERELGVRFYTPSVTVTPKKARYTFTHLDHSEKPGVRVRNDFYFEAFEPIWAARNRVNGAMGYREQPGGLEAYWAVHTFYPLMPPDEFFASHPEYYSLIDGKRQWERAQLCLTNPDVLRIMTERIREKMRTLPEYLIYDVSQNDWANPCQCDNCQAIAKAEGSESGVVIWFVNQVADAVKEEFPDKFIGTLAYQYTRKPPKTITPRDNVVVRFCSIECCFAHPFTECPRNADFVEDMNGWAALAPHIYIWDYVVNFSHYVMPYPNFRVLQPNIQFFRDHNAIGIMEQAAYQSRGGEFAELRSYLIAKLLWNPEADVETIIDDFMYGYYGRAGQFVRAYFDLLHGQLTPDTHIGLGLTPEDKLFTDQFVRDAEAIFDRAEAVADDEAIRQRVELARLPVMYLKCKRNPREALADGTYDRFCAIVKREKVENYAEAGAPHKQAFHDAMESLK